MPTDIRNTFSGRAAMILLLVAAAGVDASVYHVKRSGDDSQSGSSMEPLRTIQAAADLAQPGDHIRIYAGTYREQINPPRGGLSDEQRIVYEAAPGEEVLIKGSEIIKGWVPVAGSVWKVTLDNARTFGDFNPYNDLIQGDWCRNTEDQRTGMIYINGDQMVQAKDREEFERFHNRRYFISEVGEETTILWANFGNIDPNKETIEINVRQSCFFPTEEGINFLTIRGFTFAQAATPWAPPSAIQIGMITVHWCKGWIIEHNTLTDSRCVGITLGKFGDEFDNTKGDRPGGGYHNEVVVRAVEYGWSKETIGHHLVRHNLIYKCGQAGIVGAHGGAFSVIEDNVVHTCAKGQRFAGAEKAGIKLHGAVDTIINRNHVYNCAGSGALWLDWMMQGMVVKNNLLHSNLSDLNFEVNHGPTAIYNNFFLSGSRAVKDWSNGAAYVHNLIVGRFDTGTQGRQTPFFDPHALTGYQMAGIPDGDDRLYNNLFVGTDMTAYDSHDPMWMEGNVYLAGGIPTSNDTDPLVLPGIDPAIEVKEASDGWYLEMNLDPAWSQLRKRPLVSTDFLPPAQTMNQAYENPDGSDLVIDRDYFGNRRTRENPFPGPIEFSPERPQRLRLKVWPVE